MKVSDLQRFKNWMRENTVLSESSIRHYSQAVGTINKVMLEAGVISYSLGDISSLRVEIAIDRIMRSTAFIAKNTKGNNMYSNGLKQYRQFRLSDYVCTYQELEQCIDTYPVKNETEREALVKARIGQGLFKKQLIEKYGEVCLITGITTGKLLIASHIKPWAVSNNEERLSPDNGFLLTPTFDKLFDNGLISFKNNGSRMVSTQLNEDTQSKLGIAADDVFDIGITPLLKNNLEYHREVIFSK